MKNAVKKLSGCLYIEHRDLYRLPRIMRDLVHRRFEWILGKMDSSVKSRFYLHSPDSHGDILMSQRLHLRKKSDDSDMGVVEFRISDPDLQICEGPRPSSSHENNKIKIEYSREIDISKKFDDAVLTSMEAYAEDVDYMIYVLQKILDKESQETPEKFKARQAIREEAMIKFPCWEFQSWRGDQIWK